MNIISQKLSAARKLKGLTQEELAERANVNLRTIQRIERSETEPHPKTLQLICDALEVDTDTFHRNTSTKSIPTNVMEAFFLIVFNLILMSITGF